MNESVGEEGAERVSWLICIHPTVRSAAQIGCTFYLFSQSSCDAARIWSLVCMAVRSILFTCLGLLIVQMIWARCVEFPLCSQEGHPQRASCSEWSILGPPNSLPWCLADFMSSSLSGGCEIRALDGGEEEGTLSVTLSSKLFSGVCLETAQEAAWHAGKGMALDSFRPRLIRVTVWSNEEAEGLIWC